MVANLDGDRCDDLHYIPDLLLDEDYYTISVSFQPKIIMHALDDYVFDFKTNAKPGQYQYPKKAYSDVGL